MRRRAGSHHAAVRQLLGRPGEVWSAESAADHLMVLRWRSQGAARQVSASVLFAMLGRRDQQASGLS